MLAMMRTSPPHSPQVSPRVGVLSKDTSSGNNLDASIGDILGGLMSGGKGGIDIDDMLGLARKCFWFLMRGPVTQN